jgi:hypothetical protein
MKKRKQGPRAGAEISPERASREADGKNKPAFNPDKFFPDRPTNK